MSRSRSLREKQTFLLYLAISVLIILTIAYFFFEGKQLVLSKEIQDQSLKNFFQSVSGNIIATVLSFIVIYLLFTSKQIPFSDDETSSKTLNKAYEILSRINQALSSIDIIKEAVASHDRTGKVNDAQNPNWLWIALNEGPNKEKLDKISKVDRNLDECLKKITALLKGNLEAEERYELDKENTSLKIDLESLKGVLKNFQTELKIKEGEIIRQNRELDNKNYELSLGRRKLEEREDDLKSKDRQIREMHETLSSLKKEISNLTSTVNGFAAGFTSDIATMNAKLVSTIGNSNANQEQVLQQFRSNTSYQLEQFGSSTNYQLAKITKILETSKGNGNL